MLALCATHWRAEGVAGWSQAEARNGALLGFHMVGSLFVERWDFWFGSILTGAITIDRISRILYSNKLDSV